MSITEYSDPQEGGQREADARHPPRRATEPYPGHGAGSATPAVAMQRRVPDHQIAGSCTEHAPETLRVGESFFTARFAKRLVLLNGLVPMALLVWDAFHEGLGVNDVNYAIRTTGLVGLVLLILTLAVTPLRRLTGWGQIIAVRRTLGVLSFFYIASHFAIFFLFDRAASVTSTVEEIVSRTYLQIGTIALVLMAALAITSTDGMVSRLGARRWKWLHRLVYPIAILAVLHFWLLVKSDIRAPRAFAIILGALFLYRIIRHYLDLRAAASASKARVTALSAAPTKKRFWSGELRVARIFQETPDVRTFRLVSPDGSRLPFEHRPGQYLNITLTIDGKPVRRSYTIASTPTRPDACEITVKRVPGGLASNHLHAHVREGDLLPISAPAGRFVFDGAHTSQVLLIAGGVGVTPIMAVLRYLTDRAWAGRIDLVLAFRTRADLIFADELAYLARRFPNLHMTTTLSQPAPADAWPGPTGHITAELLTRNVPDLAHVPILLCGPDPMMGAMRTLLQSLGVPDAHIATEAFVSRPANQAGVSDAADHQPPSSPEATSNVSFSRSKKSATTEPGQTLLECAEQLGVAVPFECRSGVCGQCKTRLLSGRVVMPVQDALSRSERERGLVLACQARPTSADVTVDA